MDGKKGRAGPRGRPRQSIAWSTKDGLNPLDQQTETDNCPSNSGTLNPSLASSGYPHQYTQSSQVPESHQFYKSCLAPWKPICEDGIECCSNKSCEVMSVLLICDIVIDPTSKVVGCPIFRACPKCLSLIMHSDGCKYVCCKNCKYRFCFICLECTESCAKSSKLYWSLTCKKPRAERQ